MTLDNFFDKALDGAIHLVVWVIVISGVCTVAMQTFKYLQRSGII